MKLSDLIKKYPEEHIYMQLSWCKQTVNECYIEHFGDKEVKTYKKTKDGIMVIIK